MMLQKSHFPLMQSNLLANDNVPVDLGPPYIPGNEDEAADNFYLSQVEQVWS
jgi:hypothetical protein